MMKKLKFSKLEEIECHFFRDEIEDMMIERIGEKGDSHKIEFTYDDDDEVSGATVTVLLKKEEGTEK